MDERLSQTNIDLWWQLGVPVKIKQIVEGKA
jgi:hypothetical protein